MEYNLVRKEEELSPQVTGLRVGVPDLAVYKSPVWVCACSKF